MTKDQEIEQLEKEMERLESLKNNTRKRLLRIGFEEDEIGSWMRDFDKARNSYLALINLLKNRRQYGKQFE